MICLYAVRVVAQFFEINLNELFGLNISQVLVNAPSIVLFRYVSKTASGHVTMQDYLLREAGAFSFRTERNII